MNAEITTKEKFEWLMKQPYPEAFNMRVRMKVHLLLYGEGSFTNEEIDELYKIVKQDECRRG